MQGTPPSGRLSAGRILIVAAFVGAGVAVFALGWDDYLSLSALREHRAALLAWHQQAPLLSSLAFVLAYAAVVALSLPGAVWLTIAGGFLFGTGAGMLFSVAGATTGAVLLFVAARHVFADAVRARVGPTLARMEAGFHRNALSYLLFLRLMPVFPFWLVNLVPALLGVSLGTFLVATVVGIIPGSLVYALIGNGLGAILDAGGEPDLAIIFAPEVLAPLVGLALLSLAPVVYKGWRNRRRPADAAGDGR